MGGCKRGWEIERGLGGEVLERITGQEARRPSRQIEKLLCQRNMPLSQRISKTTCSGCLPYYTAQNTLYFKIRKFYTIKYTLFQV